MNKRTIKRMLAAMMCAVMLLTCAPLNGLGTKSYAATNIPSDAVVYNGHSYKVYVDSMYFTDAKKYCEDLGGHLVTINSKNENDFICKMLENYEESEYIIGITDLDKEGDWSTWITGEKVTYTNWGTNEPDNAFGGQHIGVICNVVRNGGSQYYVGEGQWDDAKNLRFPFICEWEPEKADATLNYNNSIKLEPKTKLVEGEKYTITWKTSDSNIATVDNDGTVTAVKRGSGTVTITCIIIDSHGNTFVDTFIIVVKLSLIQWIIIFILFGWLWY